MASRSKVSPALFWAVVPIAVTAITLAITSWRWQIMASGFSPGNAWWFLRAAPIPNLLFGPIAGLITVLALPLHRRRPVAMMSLLCFLAVAGFYGLREYARLSPSVESGAVNWDEVLSYLDFFAVIAAAVGFVIVAISARLSVVVSDSVKRARRATFGDADWLTMSAAGKLFPSVDAP